MVSLSPEEAQIIERAAERCGVTAATYLRDAGLDAACEPLSTWLRAAALRAAESRR